MQERVPSASRSANGNRTDLSTRAAGEAKLRILVVCGIRAMAWLWLLAFFDDLIIAT
jgi:hypothetical protein